MPAYDIAGRRQVHVPAPAQSTFAVASEINLRESAIARVIFRTRSLVVGGEIEMEKPRPLGLIDQTKA